MDIARLGLAIDSSAVKSATSDLDRLTPSAARAERATSGLEAAARKANEALRQLAYSKDGALAGFATGLEQTARTLNDMSAVGQRGLDQLRAKFSPLFAAQQQYKQQLGDIKDAHRLGALTQAEYEKAIETTKTSFVRQVSAIRNGTAQFKGISFEARNLGFQLVDVAQGALMGQSAFQIFAQQGGQVAQVIATSPRGLGGLVKELGAGLRALISPATLAAGTVGLLAVGAYAAYSSWKTFALQLDDTAKIAGTTSSAMAQLQAAASFKGIEQGDFAKGIQGFAAQLYQARNNIGDMVQMLRVNGVSAAGDFSTVLGRVADLVKDAAGNTELQFRILRSAGLPATMEWVRFLSQGADGIKQASSETVKLANEMSELAQQARESNEAWDKFWTNFGLKGQAATTKAILALNILTDKAKIALGAAPAPETPAGMVASRFGASNTVNTPLLTGLQKRAAAMRGDSPIVDPSIAAANIARQQQYLSLLGQTMTAEQAKLAIDLQVQAAALNGVNIDSKRAELLKQLAYEQALGITAIKAATDATNIEAAAIGMSIGQATAHAAAQNAINDARRRGVELLPQEIALIYQNAEALGQATQRADQMRFAYDTFKGTFVEFGQNLRRGESLWDSFAKSGVNALGKIADKLMEMAVMNLWSAAFGNANPIASFGSGLVQGLFASTARSGGLVGSLTNRAFVHPAYFDDAPRFSTGGRITDDGVPIIAHPGERILNRQQTRAYDEGRGSAPPVVQITNQYTFQGVEPGMEARMKAYIDQGDRNSVEQSVKAVATVSGNTPAYRGQVAGR